MCGIAGLVAWGSTPPIGASEYVDRMGDILETIRHRGPDDHGIAVFCRSPAWSAGDRRSTVAPYEPADVALGHRRLSIIDLSEAGRQPMASPDGRLQIVFNGEIYNYVELRAELAGSYSFRTHTDTEVLLAAYRRWGVDMLRRLDGMFAFVLLDLDRNVLFGARDPMGIKPLYFHRAGERFIFGSEPKAVLEGLGATGTLDLARTAEFLLFGVTDHDAGTFFREVQQLEGGSGFRLDLVHGTFDTWSYWFPPDILDEPPPDCFDRYREVAREVVRRQLRSDVPVGSSLSGGIDSSTIVTLAGELMNGRAGAYSTLTFTFPGFEDDESELARAIARTAGMAWHPIQPSSETMADDLERMIVSMGEPFSTLSMFAQYKVMERAGQLGLKVMLDGQGGDEVYLGYPRMAQRVMMQHLQRGRVDRFVQEWTGLKKHLSIGLARSLAGNLYFNSDRIALWRNMRALSRYVDLELLEQHRPDVAADYYEPKPVSEKQIDELRKYCLPRLLRYADRNSMAFSVEQRVPHLSTLMLDYALSMPISCRVYDGWTKYLVRRGMDGRIPDDVLWSTVKRGFDIPQSFWVEQLSDRIHTWIEGLPADGPFNRDALREDLIDPYRNGSSKLWGVVSVVAFIQLLSVRL